MAKQKMRRKGKPRPVPNAKQASKGGKQVQPRRRQEQTQVSQCEN